MRLALPLLLLLSIAVAAPAAATPAPATPPVKAKLVACETALSESARRATFEGDMRGLKRGGRLQIRFTLKARAEDRRRWKTVAAPGFGDWNSSAPGIGRYVYTKTVSNLPAAAEYRTVVSFRWLSAAGRTLMKASRTSRTCRQPDLRPDLVPVELVDAGPGGDGLRRYALVIRNAGRSSAAGSTATLTIAGRTTQLAIAGALAPGAEARVEGYAPACSAGETAVARVDAGDAVEEADEESNAIVSACPVPAGR